ncbi:glycosyltransferase N-terminal domain-containing protein [uncultured Desulfosarcina sp.]|uniref:3-deoxy-D-manno-octulosonic acid transferase n=1 Tax=uncultured Desulfosarcina sp. TaxID=218289 RepID=UPI0029C6BA42|nr:glycosyltransferase N-terminal domain-containing protein [uncultured Desulfosarcina sp.]
MNIFHFAYNFLASGLSLVVLPAIWCHEKKDPERKAALAQRMGYGLPHRDPAMSVRPRIWIHAVSVGEVKAAEAIVSALEISCTQASILITTTTMTGQRYACRQFDGRATVRYAPVDLWRPIGRFFSAYRPDLLICMETEIWPNWILKAHGAGIKTVFINGRISDRSIRSYRKIRRLMKPVLEKVDAFSMISEADARRIVSLGAPAHRVHINGNAKMDAPDVDWDDAVIQGLKRLYAVDETTPVFIAGSIRGGEADILMDVYYRLRIQIPGLVFILAPRHINKSSRIAETARAKGIECQYRTELEKTGAGRSAPVVILDTIGELRNVYSIASVVFCGASLVPLGGQNVLEAAVWGKPVLFGPSMEDFEEARTLLETFGGGICVKDGRELADRAIHLLKHPDVARRMGRLAKRAVLSNQGAARRHAQVVRELLPVPPVSGQDGSFFSEG